MYRPLWIEVNLKALGGNFKAIRSYLGRKVEVVATISSRLTATGLFR